MAVSFHTRLLHRQKQEHEIRLFVNSFDEDDDQFRRYHIANVPQDSKSVGSSIATNNVQSQSSGACQYDYQVPLTAHSLKPNSKWLIVRQNLHRIRFMSYNNNKGESRLPDFYLGLQMIRELKRVQDEIQRVGQERNFHAVKRFVLAIDDKHTNAYDTRHVKPDDAIIYDRLGEESMSLQNLLYYFSQQNIDHGTVFWDFLNKVNHVLNMNRKRTVLVQRLRKLAQVLTFIVYGIIGFMFFLLIASVITTVGKMSDPELKWMSDPDGQYSTDSQSSI
ncbi:unnamed protein product [Rotaria magnacalcarata]|uniref:Uncharacterized protein n=1 Tax=Rotaria magnacalcarata TaxID=392030 RepID=A0A816UB97_9BILA|nr:unnamed protein product [Rotaria magnacalcarata]CAF4096580.1 unnamed protein product [Rotaria magnacalcarata]